jgi:hypothetical protein
MDYKKQFEKETGDNYMQYDDPEHLRCYTYEFVSWLIDKLKDRDDKLKQILDISAQVLKANMRIDKQWK